MDGSLRGLRAKIAAAAVLMLLVPAMAEAQTKVKSGFNMFSPQQDVEIGQQSAAQAERQLPLVQDREVQNYVSTLGQRLAASAPGTKFPYQFRVVNASDLNAFALPGGFVYINRGTIEAAKNEGELAGVIAHEISHVALRHGTHNASKAYLTQAGLGILGGILGGKVGGGANTAQIINVLGGFGLNALFLKYSREAETDADILGSQILTKSGYNPADMASFFQTIQKQDSRKVATWMSSHPQPAQRIARIEKEARLMGVALKPSTRTAALDAVQADLRRLPAARTTEQLAQMRSGGTGTGTTSSNRVPAGRIEAPSRTMQTYTNRSRLFQLQIPSNWGVVDENPNGVTFSTRGGYAETRNGGNEIIYGAIVSHYESEDGPRTSLTEATNELVDLIVRSSPHLRPIQGSGQRFNLAGGTGLGVTLRGNSPVTGIAERVTVVTRQLSDGHLIYMIFISPDRDAQALAPTLNAMVNSMRVDPSRRH